MPKKEPGKSVHGERNANSAPARSNRHSPDVSEVNLGPSVEEQVRRGIDGRSTAAVANLRGTKSVHDTARARCQQESPSPGHYQRQVNTSQNHVNRSGTPESSGRSPPAPQSGQQHPRSGVRQHATPGQPEVRVSRVRPYADRSSTSHATPQAPQVGRPSSRATHSLEDSRSSRASTSSRGHTSSKTKGRDAVASSSSKKKK